MLSIAELNAINQQFELATPQETLDWAWKEFGPDMAATSSFQTQSLPLLHMIAMTIPELPIYFLDTGFHFPETLAFRDQLIRDFGLHVIDLAAAIGHEGFVQQYGELYRANPDLCCYINKVEPLQRVKTGLRAWVAGIRRDQTDIRRDAAIVSRERNGQYKICPLATWTSADTWRYIHRHDLPMHPLLAQGYMSVGCAPCTLPVQAGEDERSGRWAGQAKTECGLHVDRIPPPHPERERP